MGRYRDNAPVGHTCPMIDKVISFLEKIDWDSDDEDENDLDKECKEIVDVMEDIRKANDALRTWGNEEYIAKEEFEKEKDELEKQVSDLKYEIETLEAEIEKLEEEN